MNIGFEARRLALSYGLEGMMRYSANRKQRWLDKQPTPPAADTPRPEHPISPEDFRPLETACFQDPYDFYKMLRDDYPLYQLENGIYCVSRHEDICAVAVDTDNYSSTYQGVIAGLRPGQSVEERGRAQEKLGGWGVVPANVLALSDPPKHKNERRACLQGLNVKYVRDLESQIEDICRDMMEPFLQAGEVEFMQEFAWRLPMQLIMGLLGFPLEDYEKVKEWCVWGVASQSGISTSAELSKSQAASIAFTRYCWRQYRIAQKHRRDDLCNFFVEASADPKDTMTDQLAVSAIFQLLIAGSDSSATSMGNALKLLIQNPILADGIRDDMDKLAPFIEEVFRLEAAFQGNFRWTKHEVELHGTTLPKDSRIFLMWASGNRDERVFDNPNEIDLNRINHRKHLTFGHGIHACLGQVLARIEIEVVLEAFLTRTKNLRITGETPFLASMFAHTLVSLPIAFDVVPKDTAADRKVA